MSGSKLTTLRLGDNINYPQKGENVGVHYTLRNESEQTIESTYKWGKIFEWRVGQSSVLAELDEAIRSVSLGGKIRLVVALPESREPTRLTYELELLYIK
jgi:FKBP-type peptidyl-prolyl cis-trans isomerase